MTVCQIYFFLTIALLWGEGSSGGMQGGRCAQSVSRFRWQPCPLLQDLPPVKFGPNYADIGTFFPVNAVLVNTLTFVEDCITSQQAFFRIHTSSEILEIENKDQEEQLSLIIM